MPEIPFADPASLTFEAAIALTQSLLNQMAQEELSETEVEAAIAALVQTETGARGFFVTYLTDPRPFADQPGVAIVRAFQSSPHIIAELLIKNVAMSSAMAVTHRSNQNEVMAQESDRVRSRSAHLIHLLQLPEITERAQKLHESAATGQGEYRSFLDRWGYDAAQRQVIEEAMSELLNQPDQA
jgi:hypothetical protein